MHCGRLRTLRLRFGRLAGVQVMGVVRSQPAALLERPVLQPALQEGEHRGEHPSARGVPPGLVSVEDIVLVDEHDPRAASPRDNCKTSSRLQAVVLGRRSVPPGLVAPLPERSPTAVPWRERPPETAGWPAKPAASEVVAHATARGCWRPVSAPSVGLEAAVNSTRKLRKNLMDFSTLSSH